jgi:hypothetical protein
MVKQSLCHTWYVVGVLGNLLREPGGHAVPVLYVPYGPSRVHLPEGKPQTQTYT